MTSPLLIEDLNLSQSWMCILSHMIKNPGIEITPLVLTITDFNEVNEARNTLDSDLFKNGLQSIETVSETIFPNSLYKLMGRDRHALYKEYNNNFPRIKKLDRRNKRGTYFQRLINYQANNENINQLERVILSIENTNINRRSKYQASIFDPSKDHINNPYQGFPCLQHVTFYLTQNGGLVLNSFYAIQYLYEKAYGNWLGLINLGKFVANELGVDFVRFNCFVSIEKLDCLSKKAAKDLLSNMQNEPCLTYE